MHHHLFSSLFTKHPYDLRYSCSMHSGTIVYGTINPMNALWIRSVVFRNIKNLLGNRFLEILTVKCGQVAMKCTGIKIISRFTLSQEVFISWYRSVVVHISSCCFVRIWPTLNMGDWLIKIEMLFFHRQEIENLHQNFRLHSAYFVSELTIDFNDVMRSLARNSDLRSWLYVMW